MLPSQKFVNTKKLPFSSIFIHFQHRIQPLRSVTGYAIYMGVPSCRSWAVNISNSGGSTRSSPQTYPFRMSSPKSSMKHPITQNFERKMVDSLLFSFHSISILCPSIGCSWYFMILPLNPTENRPFSSKPKIPRPRPALAKWFMRRTQAPSWCMSPSPYQLLGGGFPYGGSP